MTSRVKIAGVALGIVLLTAAVALEHFGLSRSMPEADATVSQLDEIRLWFTQVPQENSLSVRLVDSSGELVESSELRSDPDDGRIVTMGVPGPIASGSYTVAWRGIGDDGHVVRGDFSFLFSAQ
jgi:methionine-rich copper-binding protein CopC